MIDRLVSRIVICDTSCLIDLEKGRLLHLLNRLPFRFLVPVVVREELLDFTHQRWRMLEEDGGMSVHDLPGDGVALVQAIGRKYRRLFRTGYDCHGNGALP